MKIETKATDCEYKIETKEVVRKTIKGAKNYLQIRYIQKKADLIPKSDSEKLNQLILRAKEHPEIQKANKNKWTIDGVKFLNTGDVEGKQNKLLVNKEDALRKKFEQQFQEKTAEKIDPNAKIFSNRIRVRIPDIMFFDPDLSESAEQVTLFLETQKQKFVTLLESVMKEVRDMFKSQDIKSNIRNCVKMDERAKTKKLLDYVILFFDKQEWADELIRELDGMMFNQFILKPHILENRPPV